MSKVRIHDRNAGPWRRMAELMTPDQHHHFDSKYLDSTIFVHEVGNTESLQLTEQKYLPHVSIDLHAHEQDEAFYILAGEMRVGNRTLGPGQSLFVAGGTLYSFEAGDEGVHFLAFRPRQDLTYIPKEEFEARRLSAR